MIYLRQSLDKDGHELGINRQRTPCEHWCAARGLDVVDVIAENDTSASGKKPRPLYENMLERAAAGELGWIVAYRVDRLTRSLSELEHLITLSERTGLRIGTVAGDIDLSTDSGRLVGRILASVARGEIETKSRRHREANAQAALEGRRVGGRRPFGYNLDGSIRDDEAAAIRHGFDSYLAGVPIADIASAWSAAGFKAQKRPWERYSVRMVLTNPRYAGLRAHKGEIVGPAAWDAIVSEETWRAVRGKLKDSARKGPPAAKALLTGVAVCGVCGGRVHAGGAVRDYRMYRCGEAWGHFGRRADSVEDYVSDVLLDRIESAPPGSLVDPAARTDTGALYSEAAALRAKRDELASMFAMDELTRTQLQAGTRRISDRLEEIDALLAAAGRRDALAPLEGAEDPRAAWGDMSTGERRAAIDALMEVTLHPPGRGKRKFDPRTVGIRWKR